MILIRCQIQGLGETLRWSVFWVRDLLGEYNSNDMGNFGVSLTVTFLLPQVGIAVSRGGIDNPIDNPGKPDRHQSYPEPVVFGFLLSVQKHNSHLKGDKR